jgi:phenylacetate 2-hydroxylase
MVVLILPSDMTLPVIAVGALVVTYFAYRFLYSTETPKIRGLPEVSGLPLFGSLIELGRDHALVAQRWVKKYGPVFQVRMGNKVRITQIQSLQLYC